MIARPFVGEPELHAAEPTRLVPAAAQPNYLTLAREAGNEVHGVGKIHDIFAGSTSTTRIPHKVERRRHSADGGALREVESGFVFVNLVETDMLWGTGTTRSTSTAVSRTSTGACPICWTPFVPAISSSSLPTTGATRRRLRPTTARARALPRLRRGQERNGQAPRGGVRGRRRDGECVAGRQGAEPGSRGRPSCSRDPSGRADPAKRDGEELAADELASSRSPTRDEIPDYQMAAFCMAAYFRGLSAAETHALTDAMVESGEVIDLSRSAARSSTSTRPGAWATRRRS